MIEILVADDNLVMRNLVKFYLKKYDGVNIHEVADGLETLKFLKKNKTDILFLDLQMPNLNGFNVAKYLYEVKSDTYIVAISANVTKENMDIFKTFGVKYFLQKPLEPKSFEEVFKKIKKKIKSKK